MLPLFIYCWFRTSNKESAKSKCEQKIGTTVSRWELLRGKAFFNRTVTVELVEELKQTWDILGRFLHLFLCFVDKVAEDNFKIRYVLDVFPALLHLNQVNSLVICVA